MQKPLVLVALSAVMLVACMPDSLTAPTMRPQSPRKSFSAATGDAIAYDNCSMGWDASGGQTQYCYMLMQNADGTINYLTEGEEGTLGSALAWSPDGTRIAYDGIRVVTLADLRTRSLTPGWDAAWSPDGTRIAFTGNDDGELYLVDVAGGSNVTRLTNGVGFWGNAAWSPDGSRIAFTCGVVSGPADICAIHADGTGFVRLTSGPAVEAGPDFSPDGTRIAYSADGVITVMDADGGNVTSLGVFGERPDWSPSGDRLVFSSTDGGGACADYCETSWIRIVNADGTDLMELGGGFSPRWRPAPDPAFPDAPPVARMSHSCYYLDCSFNDGSTDDRGIVSRSWNFGDGSPAATGVSTTHAYPAAGSYTVTVTVTDEVGQTASAAEVVTVVAEDFGPVPSFTASCVLAACTFDSGASTDDHGITSRRWTFGDGGSAGDIVAPAHTYAKGGWYVVTLTVVDTQGQQRSITQEVWIDLPPVARFTYTCSGTTCTFDGRTSSDESGIFSYKWIAGNTGTYWASVVTVTFRHHSTQDVTLIVADGGGKTSSTTQTVTVK